MVIPLRPCMIMSTPHPSPLHTPLHTPNHPAHRTPPPLHSTCVTRNCRLKLDDLFEDDEIESTTESPTPPPASQATAQSGDVAPSTAKKEPLPPVTAAKKDAVSNAPAPLPAPPVAEALVAATGGAGAAAEAKARLVALAEVSVILVDILSRPFSPNFPNVGDNLLHGNTEAFCHKLGMLYTV